MQSTQARIPESPTIRTRILTVSNTGRQRWDALAAYRADVVIHCGDFVHNPDRIEEHNQAIQLLDTIRAPFKLVLPGRLDWAGAISPDNLKRIQDLWDGQKSRREPIILLASAGNHEFNLDNHALLKIFAWPYLPPGQGDIMFYSAECDVVVTYDAPFGILDHSPGHRDQHTGRVDLLHKLLQVRPRVHCFGQPAHSAGSCRVAWRPPHDPSVDLEIYSVQTSSVPLSAPAKTATGRETLFVNAARVSHRGIPCQLIDIDLPPGRTPNTRSYGGQIASDNSPQRNVLPRVETHDVHANRGQPSHGQPSHGQPSHGQPSHGQPSYGQPSHGPPPLMPPPPPGHHEPKMKQACDECYRKKVKCSQEKPMCLKCWENGTYCKYSPISRGHGSSEEPSEQTRSKRKQERNRREDDGSNDGEDFYNEEGRAPKRRHVAGSSSSSLQQEARGSQFQAGGQEMSPSYERTGEVIKIEEEDEEEEEE